MKRLAVLENSLIISLFLFVCLFLFYTLLLQLWLSIPKNKAIMIANPNFKKIWNL